MTCKKQKQSSGWIHTLRTKRLNDDIWEIVKKLEPWESVNIVKNIDKTLYIVKKISIL